MSLDHSDNLDIPDADPLDPALEATVLLKFNMHLYKSSLNETHVKWLIFEMYCRAMNITPTMPLFRVFYKLCKQCDWFSFQSRVGKNYKPCFKDAPTSLKKWQDKFFLVDWRAAPIAMPWRHHNSSMANPFPQSREFSESDAEKLHEVVITLHKPSPSLLYAAGLSHSWKHIRHVSILKDPKGKGCKVTARTLLLLGTARVTHLNPPADRLEDIPPKTGEMEVAEMSCRKVLAKKEKNRKKAEARATTKADDHDQVEKVAGKKHASEEGTYRKKKRKTRLWTPTINLDSEHVSSPTPLNHSKPLETLTNEAHVFESVFAGRLNALRNQTDVQSPPCHDVIHENVDEHMVDGGASNEHGDENIIDEGVGLIQCPMIFHLGFEYNIA
ncbi:hypothetical protein Tco_0542009 [Tanacetum coccineum]